MRYDKILNNKRYISLINEIAELEKDRIYCRHGYEHLFDVARIAYIINLEENLNIKKDVIYATALLHDIGKGEQYKTGIGHHITSVDIAKELLEETDYSVDEKSDIIKAIFEHRTKGSDSELSNIIYRADKLSRACFSCKAREKCNWSIEKKNLDLRY